MDIERRSVTHDTAYTHCRLRGQYKLALGTVLYSTNIFNNIFNIIAVSLTVQCTVCAEFALDHKTTQMTDAQQGVPLPVVCIPWKLKLPRLAALKQSPLTVSAGEPYEGQLSSSVMKRANRGKSLCVICYRVLSRDRDVVCFGVEFH